MPESREDPRESSGLGATLRDVLRAPNCTAANIITAALYFGLFGVSFLLPIYMQTVLGSSATWAGVSLFPISLVLLFSERLTQVAAGRGSRLVITTGALAAGGGILWLATGPDPLPFWSHIVPGTTIFGVGLALAVGPLTHAAVSSLPSSCAGIASGVPHATVRAAGLAAIAAVGTIGAGSGAASLTPDGFRAALSVCAAIVIVPGVLGARAIRDDQCGGIAQAGSTEDTEGTV